MNPSDCGKDVECIKCGNFYFTLLDEPKWTGWRCSDCLLTPDEKIDLLQDQLAAVTANVTALCGQVERLAQHVLELATQQPPATFADSGPIDHCIGCTTGPFPITGLVGYCNSCKAKLAVGE